MATQLKEFQMVCDLSTPPLLLWRIAGGWRVCVCVCVFDLGGNTGRGWVGAPTQIIIKKNPKNIQMTILHFFFFFFFFHDPLMKVNIKWYWRHCLYNESPSDIKACFFLVSWVGISIASRVGVKLQILMMFSCSRGQCYGENIQTCSLVLDSISEWPHGVLSDYMLLHFWHRSVFNLMW